MFKELRGIKSMKKGGKEYWEIFRNIHGRWLRSVIPALGRLREEERKFKTSPRFGGRLLKKSLEPQNTTTYKANLLSKTE